MRKGAAGYVRCILSSAIRVTSTFADVAYSKASGKPGAFFVVVVDNLPQQKRKSKPKYVKLSTSNSNILCFVENYKKLKTRRGTRHPNERRGVAGSCSRVDEGNGITATLTGVRLDIRMNDILAVVRG